MATISEGEEYLPSEGPELDKSWFVNILYFLLLKQNGALRWSECLWVLVSSFNK